MFFQYDPLVYFSFVMFGTLSWFLYPTKAWFALRAIGESPDSAHAIGFEVIQIRYLVVLFGGAMAGLGGAYFSLVYTPLWVGNMTAGQ